MHFAGQCLRDLASIKGEREFPMKTLIVVYSYHHSNTQKVAEVLAKVLDAEIKTPQQTDLEELQNYDLVGFGSGLTPEKIIPNYLTLPLSCHKESTRRRSSSQPVECLLAFQVNKK